MALVALAATWWGGVPFGLLWTIAAIAVLVEWQGMVTGRGRSAGTVIGAAALILAGVAATAGAGLAAIAVLAAASLVGAALAPSGTSRPLAGFGVLYAGTVAIPAILLRRDPSFGLAAILFLFAVVWGSDVMAYFTGRTLGGPKLWPQLSPKKTWSGFIGGTISGGVAGLAVAAAAGVPSLGPLVVLAPALAVVSQGGDLFESAIKRRFGAKDAGSLIPGHGGVMDRLDGFVAAATAALLIAWLRDPSSLAAGLLAWDATQFTIP
jgi:phosphatidate cytidylyltransferase